MQQDVRVPNGIDGTLISDRFKVIPHVGDLCDHFTDESGRRKTVTEVLKDHFDKGHAVMIFYSHRARMGYAFPKELRVFLT